MSKRNSAARKKQEVPRRTARRVRRGKRERSVACLPVGEVERVLALDSSSRACGWAVCDDGVLIGHGVYKQEGDGHGERLMRFRSWLLEMFTQWAPHVVAYEAPYQGRMKNTFGILSRYVGAIEAAHFEHYQVEIEKTQAVAAHLVKKTIGAKKGENHEANKKIVVLLVNQRFGLSLKYKSNDRNKTVTQDDEADAIALAWAWYRLYRERPREQEVA
jgi:Holliday junction resolvasome RuvABC endonuclease subunit